MSKLEKRASPSPSGYFESVETFVEATSGKFPIKRVLVANNGISAVKAIRSIRKWSYEIFGDERKVEFVAMATPEDMSANAEYIRMADEFVEVPGGANNNNYANVALLVELAQTCHVDAVFAGWGHASENPHLPETLLKCYQKLGRRIIFIGPSGTAMRALGDKIGSTIIAQSADVPCIAWNGSHLTVEVEGKHQEQSEEQFSTTTSPTISAAEDGDGEEDFDDEDDENREEDSVEEKSTESQGLFTSLYNSVFSRSLNPTSGPKKKDKKKKMKLPRRPSALFQPSSSTASGTETKESSGVGRSREGSITSVDAGEDNITRWLSNVDNCVEIPQGVYDQANVQTCEAALAAANKVGYPVMIKASEGGGGKGIRKVLNASELPDLFTQVQGEVPGSPIFIMKLAPASRHLEVQLLGDHYGNCIALSGRDCSVQRRHQKIIEEGPPLSVSPATWVDMEAAA
eukprot:g1988.t1